MSSLSQVSYSKSAVALQYTPIEDIPQIRERLGNGFKAGKTKSLEYRQNQLLQLAYLFKENYEHFREAFMNDLGRPALEASLMELDGVIHDCVEAHNNVHKWVKPLRGDWDLFFTPMSAKAYKQPKGVILIIGPFNYPITCAVSILAGAIAAGCAGVVKLSEHVPTIAALIADLFPKYMDQDLYQIVNGGVAENTALLELRWDHIVFTGSTNVGKIVAAAAAKHLTPVTLELGGQTPVFMDPKTDLLHASRRLLWGKFANAGQTCMAPNHVFVPESSQDAFVAAVTKVYDQFYPEGGAESKSFARIVSENAFNRIKGVLDNTKGEIVRGGETDIAKKYIAPTIVKNVRPGDSLLDQEIFGPILPICPVKDFQEALDFTNARGHPLAIYVFTDDSKLKNLILENTQSGAINFNEVIIHMAAPGLPFGGIGTSGYGAHTGVHSFNTFTHVRTSLDSPRWIDLIFNFRFPPYTDKKMKMVKFIAQTIPKPRPGPGIAPIGTRSVVGRVVRPFLLAVGLAVILLTLRR